MRKMLFMSLEKVPGNEDKGEYSQERALSKEFVLKEDVLNLIHGIGGCDGGDPWTRGFDDSCDTLYNAVSSMKPAEVHLLDGDCEWRPADDPPKDCQDVLICYTNGDQAVAYREAGRWWLGKFFTDTVDDADVVAWRRLPKSYCEEE